MDAAERDLLDATVRDAVGGAAPRGARTVDSALAGLGWLEMLRAEPREVLEIVFRTLGAAGAAASALDDVLAFGLGTEPRPEIAVVLPPFASWHPPGKATRGRVSALGLATARATTARQLLVVCAAEGQPSAAIIPASAAQVRAIGALDPDAAFALVCVEPVEAESRELDSRSWDSAVALGRRALAYEMAGACRAMLDLGRDHALDRVQFDRPIARFQAVRHRLADALVALEALDATLVAAADEPGPGTAALAKAVAGRSAQAVRTHCQQVLAGVGFTTDHPFHRYFKRTMTLEGIFGTADDLVLDVGRRLLADRDVPSLVEL